MKRWNKDFPMRLAVSTGISLGVLLLVIGTAVYIGVGLLLRDQIDRSLEMMTEAHINRWEETGELHAFDWEDGAYAVIRSADGSLILSDGDLDREMASLLSQAAGSSPSEEEWSYASEEQGGRTSGFQQSIWPFLQNEDTYRILAVPFTSRGERLVLTAANELEEHAETMYSLSGLLLILTTAGAALAGLLIHRMAQRGFKPVRELTGQIGAIETHTLSHRLHVPLRDSTLEQMVQGLNGMLERLEQSFTSQQQFVQNASHELRTPLAALRSDMEIALRRSRTEEEYRDVLNRSLKEVLHLQRLSNQLLQMALAESNKASLQKSSLPILELLSHCIDQAKRAAQYPGVDISLQGEQAFKVHGNREALSMLFTNLIDNACRAVAQKEKSMVRVETSLEGKWGVIRVIDNGVGIPGDSLPYVFERFYRVDAGRNRQRGGTGVGLAICRAIIEAHDGQVAVESEVNQGSMFTVRLQLGEAEVQD